MARGQKAEVVRRVDEKAMLRNLYNQIPHPPPDTIRERNTNNQDGTK